MLRTKQQQLQQLLLKVHGEFVLNFLQNYINLYHNSSPEGGNIPQLELKSYQTQSWPINERTGGGTRDKCHPQDFAMSKEVPFIFSENVPLS